MADQKFEADKNINNLKIMITENVKNQTANVEKKKLHSNFETNKTEITQDQITYNKNLQELHVTHETNIKSEDLAQTNISNHNKNEISICSAVTSSNEDIENEIFDWNEEHNWRNKNEKKKKRMYLDPRPDFTGVCKKRRREKISSNKHLRF
ncbi:hypothetical protein PUN28_013941 [Cardiocondyla obscurior]|uniref:Uncharacterized protein n=1 Tax=Cardiocondyla obscurior TaxID=286306 RepID=A0AAW2F908_9HYME